MLRKIALIAVYSLCFACAPPANERIAGTWQVVSITSEAELPEHNIDDFRLSFTKEGAYQYFGNLYYREAGIYAIEGSYLYTTDTLNQEASEKVVQIIKLVKDSLYLRMADETVMKLSRIE